MNSPAPLPPQDASSDPRCTPIKLTSPIPIGDEIAYPWYEEEEHAIWRDLYRRQEELLPGRASDEFLSGLQLLALDRQRIPSLSAVSKRLQKATGWKIARTPGLLDAHDFFAHLARRVFPCTDYIRTRAEMDYTPAPDCFHDIFGHTPMIVHPQFADFYQRMGVAALACRDAAVEEQLTRIYWFTVEFGLIQNPAGLRIYGNGIISSYGETLNCFKDEVTRLPFEPSVVGTTAYDIWHFQNTLFVIRSFQELVESFDTWARSHRLL